MAWPNLQQGWRSLRHRNFRLFFSGQSISLIGTWMTRVATSWLIFRLTHSALMLGTVSFVGQLPSFLLAPFAGVLVDRWDRRSILVGTQVLSMVQSLALAVLALTNVINIGEIIFLSALQGSINAFDMPARQSFMVRMVEDRQDLSNAIALNSTMVNVARFIGPTLASLIIAVTNEGWCFLIDGLSYGFVIASLLMMRVERAKIEATAATMVYQLQEGWRYVRGSFSIRTILTLFAVVNLMGWPYMVLLPIFATDILHGGPQTYGFLLAAVGIGSVAAAIQMAMRRSTDGLTLSLPVSTLIFGAGLILFGLVHVFWLSFALMVIVGYGLMQCMAGTNTLLQTLVVERMRGRVMSYYTMAFVGTAPFGSLVAGAIAHRIGAPLTVIASGVASMAVAIWFLTRRSSVESHVSIVHGELALEH
ncbi:MAG TPA: MFS transporter [Fimbriimonas sp.]|nr:MFS transporter [Fimbriimonas sp.]